MYMTRDNEDCSKRRQYRYNSCRNRHCPGCGGLQKQEWIEKRMSELLPVPYFHVVFTLPHQLNGLILGNRAALFHLLQDSSWYTLNTFGKDPKHLGATLGSDQHPSYLGTATELSSPCSLHCQRWWYYSKP